MKVFKFLSIGVLVAGMILVIGCNKDDKVSEPINGARVYNFNLEFNAGDVVKSYSGITGYKSNDVILTYVYYTDVNSEKYWVQIPAVLKSNINVMSQFSQDEGKMYIRTEFADGSSGSPWTTTVNLPVKAVLIKGTALNQFPTLDLAKYKAVKEAFNLED